MAASPSPSFQRFAEGALVQHSKEMYERARRLELEAALGKYKALEFSRPKPPVTQPKRKVILLCS